MLAGGNRRHRQSSQNNANRTLPPYMSTQLSARTSSRRLSSGGGRLGGFFRRSINIGLVLLVLVLLILWTPLPIRRHQGAQHAARLVGEVSNATEATTLGRANHSSGDGWAVGTDSVQKADVTLRSSATNDTLAHNGTASKALAGDSREASDQSLQSSSVTCHDVHGLRYCKYRRLYWIDQEWVFVDDSQEAKADVKWACHTEPQDLVVVQKPRAETLAQLAGRVACAQETPQYLVLIPPPTRVSNHIALALQLPLLYGMYCATAVTCAPILNVLFVTDAASLQLDTLAPWTRLAGCLSRDGAAGVRGLSTGALSIGGQAFDGYASWHDRWKLKDARINSTWQVPLVNHGLEASSAVVFEEVVLLTSLSHVSAVCDGGQGQLGGGSLKHVLQDAAWTGYRALLRQCYGAERPVTVAFGVVDGGGDDAAHVGTAGGWLAGSGQGDEQHIAASANTIASRQLLARADGASEEDHKSGGQQQQQQQQQASDGAEGDPGGGDGGSDVASLVDTLTLTAQVAASSQQGSQKKAGSSDTLPAGRLEAQQKKKQQQQMKKQKKVPSDASPPPIDDEEVADLSYKDDSDGDSTNDQGTVPPLVPYTPPPDPHAAAVHALLTSPGINPWQYSSPEYSLTSLPQDTKALAASRSPIGTRYHVSCPSIVIFTYGTDRPGRIENAAEAAAYLRSLLRERQVLVHVVTLGTADPAHVAYLMGYASIVVGVNGAGMHLLPLAKQPTFYVCLTPVGEGVGSPLHSLVGAVEGLLAGGGDVRVEMHPLEDWHQVELGDHLTALLKHWGLKSSIVLPLQLGNFPAAAAPLKPLVSRHSMVRLNPQYLFEVIWKLLIKLAVHVGNRSEGGPGSNAAFPFKYQYQGQVVFEQASEKGQKYLVMGKYVEDVKVPYSTADCVSPREGRSVCILRNVLRYRGRYYYVAPYSTVAADARGGLPHLGMTSGRTYPRNDALDDEALRVVTQAQLPFDMKDVEHWTHEPLAMLWQPTHFYNFYHLMAENLPIIHEHQCRFFGHCTHDMPLMPVTKTTEAAAEGQSSQQRRLLHQLLRSYTASDTRQTKARDNQSRRVGMKDRATSSSGTGPNTLHLVVKAHRWENRIKVLEDVLSCYAPSGLHVSIFDFNNGTEWSTIPPTTSEEAVKLDHVLVGYGNFRREMFSGGRNVALQFLTSMDPVPPGVLLSFRKRLGQCMGLQHPMAMACAGVRHAPTVLFVQREGVRSWINLEDAIGQLEERFRAEGLQVPHFESMVADPEHVDVMQQAQRVSSADIVVVMHGAANGHYIFTRLHGAWLEQMPYMYPALQAFSMSMARDFPYYITTLYPQTTKWSDVEVMDRQLAAETIQRHFSNVDVEQVLQTGQFPEGGMDTKEFHVGLFSVVASNARYRVDVDDMMAKLSEAIRHLPPPMEELSLS